jgi:DNA repair protein RecO (recombination protein O)
MHVKDQAICLRAVNYSDTSQVVTMLCRDHGKIAAMAKGSRRPKNAFDGPIEVFSCGDAAFVTKDSGGQLANLAEFSQKPLFRGLTRNLPALNAALFAAELTESFLEDHDPHPPLYDKFLKFLSTVQDSHEEPLVWAWLILYQIRLLEETGIAPVWDRCVNCNASLEIKDRVRTAQSSVYFSSRNNGLLCSGCETAFVEKRVIDWKIVGALQHPASLPKMDFETLKETEALMIYHLTELMHRPPKMAKYFT